MGLSPVAVDVLLDPPTAADVPPTLPLLVPPTLLVPPAPVLLEPPLFVPLLELDDAPPALLEPPFVVADDELLAPPLFEVPPAFDEVLPPAFDEVELLPPSLEADEEELPPAPVAENEELLPPFDEDELLLFLFDEPPTEELPPALAFSHLPLLQDLPSPHLLPQVPQLAGSIDVSVHTPEQREVGAGQLAELPLLQPRVVAASNRPTPQLIIVFNAMIPMVLFGWRPVT